MIITVSYRSNYSKSPKIYLLEIQNDNVTWHVLKRFQQFRELHESFKNIRREGYQYRFTKFPRRMIMNSYKDDTISERVALLTDYFTYLTSDSQLSEHTILDTFIHSDIYLDSYQTLKEADALMNDIEKSRKLRHQLQRLYEDVETQETEYHSVGDKYSILKRNATNLLEQIQDVHQRLESGNNKSKQTHNIKREIHENIKQVSQQYNTLRCHLSLTESKQVQTKSNLEQLKQTVLQLTDMVEDATIRIRLLEDTCLERSWNCDEYGRINHQIHQNITEKLAEMETTFIF